MACKLIDLLQAGGEPSARLVQGLDARAFLRMGVTCHALREFTEADEHDERFWRNQRVISDGDTSFCRAFANANWRDSYRAAVTDEIHAVPFRSLEYNSHLQMDLSARAWIGDVGFLGLSGAEGVDPPTGRAEMYKQSLEEQEAAWEAGMMRQIHDLEAQLADVQNSRASLAAEVKRLFEAPLLAPRSSDGFINELWNKMGSALCQEQQLGDQAQAEFPDGLRAEECVMVTLRGAKMLVILGSLGSAEADCPIAEFPVETGKAMVELVVGVRVAALHSGMICIAEEALVQRIAKHQCQQSPFDLMPTHGVWTNPFGCWGRVCYSERSETGMKLHIGDPVAGHEGVSRFEHQGFWYNPDGSTRFQGNADCCKSLMLSFAHEDSSEEGIIAASPDGVDILGTGGPDSGGGCWQASMVMPLEMRKAMREESEQREREAQQEEDSDSEDDSASDDYMYSYVCKVQGARLLRY